MDGKNGSGLARLNGNGARSHGEGDDRWRQFMRQWHRIIEFRVMRSELYAKMGRADPQFSELADDVEAFAEACRFLKTMGEEDGNGQA